MHRLDSIFAFRTYLHRYHQFPNQNLFLNTVLFRVANQICADDNEKLMLLTATAILVFDVVINIQNL